MIIQMTLPVNADLAGVSAMHAEELIREHFGAKGTMEFYQAKPFFTLHTASQSFGEAMRVCHLLGYSYQIDTEFPPDAWKLVGRNWNSEAKEFDVYEVFSAGA